MANHRHQCMIYSGSPQKHMEALAQSLMTQLKAGNRCLYLHGPTMVARMRVVLEDAGVNVDREIGLGALILSSDQSHLDHGEFDVTRMLKMLRTAVTQALADGYEGFWATGDMTWELGGEKNAAKLLAYEYGLEELFEETPGLSGICQYHRDTLPQHAVQDALAAHQSVYVNETLARMNPYYQSAQATAYPQPTFADFQLDQMVNSLYAPA